MSSWGTSSGNEKAKVRSGWRAVRSVALAPLIALVLVLPLIALAPASAQEVEPLNPLKIPKFVNQLHGPPPVFVPTWEERDGNGTLVKQHYDVSMLSFEQQILPSTFPMTSVWGYGGYAKDAVTGAPLGWIRNSPGPSFEATRGVAVDVTYTNMIDGDHMFAVDPTLHWADPNMMGHDLEPPFPGFPPGFPEAQYPVPLVTHLHGGEVPSIFDGGPEAWFTHDGMYGPVYDAYPEMRTAPGSVTFEYPNEQPPTTLWYHDHALGITRMNVMSGLAGFYLLRDPSDPIAPLLPSGKYDMPLVIQDRMFLSNGDFYFPDNGINPGTHPYWIPEFFGNTMMVNGKVWPNMDVDRAVYRFRLLDGSNARFYTLTLWDRTANARLPFVQIASDGGYLRAPVALSGLTIAPGERAEILVDFTNIPKGHKIVLMNSAKAPFPKGAPVDPRTTAQIMQFTVTGTGPVDTMGPLPPILNDALSIYPSLPSPDRTRVLTLVEVMGENGPLEILLNGQKWMSAVSELPEYGSTEEWVLVNPTMDTHPIHLHLTQFQLVSRQKIDAARYYDGWLGLNEEGLMEGMIDPPFEHDWIPLELPVGPYLQGKPMLAPPNEQGWKDTVRMNPGEVTVIRVSFAPIDDPDGDGLYPFDPTVGPGYVWHCHILDHEDNEMMRPYLVVPKT